MKTPLRVLIADDHTLFRRGLRQVCELEGGFEVVGEAADGVQAVELARRLKPDVILMDIQMPGLDGVEATRRIVTADPDARVVILTVYQRDAYVFEALKAGARGYLLKDVDEDRLVAGVRAVRSGGMLVDAQVAGQVVQEFQSLTRDDIAQGDIQRLTNGEMEVLCLAAEGLDNQAIAKRLNLSPKTVANRMSTVYEKLQVNSRVQAALYALRQGWTELEP